MTVKYEIVVTDQEVTIEQPYINSEKVKPIVTLQCREIPENRMQIIVRDEAYVALITHEHGLKEIPRYMLTPFINRDVFAAMKQLPDLK